MPQKTVKAQDMAMISGVDELAVTLTCAAVTPERVGFLCDAMNPWQPGPPLKGLGAIKEVRTAGNLVQQVLEIMQ